MSVRWILYCPENYSKLYIWRCQYPICKYSITLDQQPRASMLTLPWHDIEFLLNLALALPAPPLPPHSQPQLLLSPISHLSSQCFQTSIIPNAAAISAFPSAGNVLPENFLPGKPLLFCQFNNSFPVMISLGMSLSDFGHFLSYAATEPFHTSSTFVCALLTLFGKDLLKVHLAHLWFSKEWGRGKYREEKEVKMRVQRGVEKMGNVAWLVEDTRMRLS